MAFPVFQFDQSAFPLLTPAQTSPFGGVLSDAIAKRLALAKAQEAENEAPYAGIAKLIQMKAQNAYSNAVIPQYQAKLLGVPGAIANLQHPQTTLNALENYGQPGTTGNQLQDYINDELNKIIQKQASQQGSGSGILGTIGTGIKNLFTGGGGEETAPTEVPQAAPRQSISDAIVNAQLPVAQTPATRPTGTETPAGRSPESVAYTQNQATAGKEVAKGTSQGTEEGKQQAGYGSEAQAVVQQQYSLNNLNNMYSDPELQAIGNVPYATAKSMAWNKQTGNPQLQRKLGNLEAAEKNFVASSFKIFGNKMTDQDRDFLERWKPSDSDPINVRQGKMNEIGNYINFMHDRIELSDHYMGEGMSKAAAEFQAVRDIKAGKTIEDIKEAEAKTANNAKNKSLYAQTVEEWERGKQAEATKTVNGKRMLKIGGKWYAEG